jgi:uncharacterized peroxidase-related enzyme
MEDYRQAELDPAVRALLDFAVQVTTNPHAVGETAISSLRAAGWSDAAILEAVEVIGFFNYYNRLVDALGVDPEPEWGETKTAPAPDSTWPAADEVARDLG